MNLNIINPLDIPNWDELILAFPDYSFFHSSTWARVLFESYEYTPFYFSLWDGGELIAMIPIMEVDSFLTGKRGVSLPFTDFCGPIIRDYRDFPDLFYSIQELGLQRDWKFVEFRGGRDYFREEPSSGSYYLHNLDLNDNPERIYSRFKKSYQRNIKKARKEGLKVELHQDLEAVKEFYRLNRLTRRGHGLPPQPFHFFKKIYDYIISRGLGFVALADYRGKKVAGAVFFRLGLKAIYKYGASLKKTHHLRANNLVMWEAIKWLAENNFQELHLGRTDFDHEGLRRFKTGWGAVESSAQYFKYDFRQASFVQGKIKERDFTRALFRQMPGPVLQLLGKVAYRHMG